MLRDMNETERHNGSPVSLFDELPAVEEQQVIAAKQARAASRRQGPPRLLQPNRGQIELRASDLESLLGEDHRARLVWGYVERQDLSRLIESIKARGSNAGRSAIDPRILFALWLYATLDAVGSGRVGHYCGWLQKNRTAVADCGDSGQTAGQGFKYGIGAGIVKTVQNKDISGPVEIGHIVHPAQKMNPVADSALPGQAHKLLASPPSGHCQMK